MHEDPYVYNAELLSKVRASGFMIKDLCGIARVPLKEMYEILAGLYEPPESTKARIAAAIGCHVHEIFQQNKRCVIR